MIACRLRVSLLCAAGIAALSTGAQAQQAAAPAPDNGTETVVVTGSRVIADAANSPTPLTVVSTQQLQATTPSNIPDALNNSPLRVVHSSSLSNRTSHKNSLRCNTCLTVILHKVLLLKAG